MSISAVGVPKEQVWAAVKMELICAAVASPGSTNTLPARTVAAGAAALVRSRGRGRGRSGSCPPAAASRSAMAFLANRPLRPAGDAVVHAARAVEDDEHVGRDVLRAVALPLAAAVAADAGLARDAVVRPRARAPGLARGALAARGAVAAQPALRVVRARHDGARVARRIADLTARALGAARALTAPAVPGATVARRRPRPVRRRLRSRRSLRPSTAPPPPVASCGPRLRLGKSLA